MVNLAWASLLLISGFRLVLSDSGSDSDLSIVPSGADSEHFIVPDGKKDDFSETYYNGDTVKVKWAGWDPWWTDEYMNGVAKANLFVGSLEPDISPFYRILSSSIDISVFGTYSWKIDISDEALSHTSKYVLVFMSVKDNYLATTHYFRSPGFLIQNSTASSSAGTTTTSPTTTSRTTTLSTTTGSLATTSSATGGPNTGAKTGGLNTGAKAGIGVGVGIGGLAVLAGLAFWFVRRRRKLSSQGMTESPEVYHPAATSHPKDHGYYQESKPHTQEVSTAPAELPSSLDRG